jgi:hypothetical protein
MRMCPPTHQINPVNGYICDRIIPFTHEQRMNFDREKNDFIFIFKRHKASKDITGFSYNKLIHHIHIVPSTRERIVIWEGWLITQPFIVE